MISLLFLATIAASPPLEARIVAFDLERAAGVDRGWSNRIGVELASAVERQVRLCPHQATVLTERRVGERLRPVDRFRAHAMSLGTVDRFTGACQDVSVGPGRPQQVSFVVRGVPGRWRREDRYTLVLDAGAARFRFIEASAIRR